MFILGMGLAFFYEHSCIANTHTVCRAFMAHVNILISCTYVCYHVVIFVVSSVEGMMLSVQSYDMIQQSEPVSRNITVDVTP